MQKYLGRNITLSYRSLGLIAIGFAFLVGAYMYTLSEQQIAFEKSTKEKTYTNPEAVMPTEVLPTPAPLSYRTVGFTKINGTLHFKFKDHVYKEAATTNENPIITDLTADAYSWQNLVTVPKMPSGYEFAEKVFDIKEFPDKNSFAFTMPWPTKVDSNSYKVFLGHFDQGKYTATEILSFTPSAKAYNVPRLKEISIDGKYIAFDMFSCWQCGGHIPDTLLYKVDTKVPKRIGEVSYFQWKDNGNYEFKENKTIPCPTVIGPYQCYEDLNNLPLLISTF